MPPTVTSVTKVKGINKKNRHTIQYPNIPSALRPVPQSDDLPVPTPPAQLADLSDTENDSSSDTDEEYKPPEMEPQLFSQDDLDDLIKDLDLSKASAELLASRLQERNLLAKGAIITRCRYREKEFRKFFDVGDGLVYCCDVKWISFSYGYGLRC